MNYIITKYWIVIILTGLISTGVATRNPITNEKKEQIQEAVLNELKFHPKATLIDIYKNFFQDVFGPAHLITNTHSVIEYIKEELKDTLAFDTIKFQKVGIENRFVRVNLSLIKDSIISLEKLADAFIKTANNSRQPSIGSWKEEWQFILRVIGEMNLSIFNFYGDKIILENMLKKGKIVVHHSDIYIKEYNPHYRLISKKYINEIRSQ